MPHLEHFETTVAATKDGRVFLPVPFNPSVIWGGATRHLGGSINAMSFRGVVEDFDGQRGIVIGPAWRRDCGLAPGAHVSAILTAEGPLRADLAADLAQALAADPKVAEFWDTLAQFYRKGYLRWIDATKRRPDVRAARIAEVVALLRAGVKQRP